MSVVKKFQLKLFTFMKTACFI